MKLSVEGKKDTERANDSCGMHFRLIAINARFDTSKKI